MFIISLAAVVITLFMVIISIMAWAVMLNPENPETPLH